MDKTAYVSSLAPSAIAGMVMAIAVVAVPACTTNSAARASSPGEYEFPVESDGPLVSHMVYSRPPALGAEIFDGQSARELLHEPTNISLYGTGSAISRQFHGMFGGSPGTLTFWTGKNLEGGDDLSITGGDIRCDPSSDNLLRNIFEYAVLGIDSGRWVLDPNLKHPGSITIRECSRICDLNVALNPGEAYRYIEKESYPLDGTVLSFGVYYEDEDWIDTNGPKVPDSWEPVTTPRVFLHGNRTRSHIFLLGQEWATKLHDAALQLEQRLLDLYKQLSARSVAFEEDHVVVRFPPAVSDVHEYVSWQVKRLWRDTPGAASTLPLPLWRTLDSGVREVFIPRGKYAVVKNYSGLLFMVSVNRRLEDGQVHRLQNSSAFVDFDSSTQRGLVDFTDD